MRNLQVPFGLRFARCFIVTQGKRQPSLHVQMIITTTGWQKKKKL
jgi:hypothetical protein